MPDHFTLLLEWRRNEAAVRGLAKLPHDFYPTTRAYLVETRRTYETDLRENPSGRKGEVARQTFQRASQLARDIVEGRSQKLLSAAFQASIGGTRDLPNALPEEREMFEQVLHDLLEYRRSAAPYLEPGGPGPSGPPPSRPAATPATVVAPPPASATPSRSGPAPPTLPPALPPMEYVRVLKDGRPIEIGSETIALKADDILSLPPESARLLVEAHVAERITPAAPRPTT